jgi:hypothetical protein
MRQGRGTKRLNESHKASQSLLHVENMQSWENTPRKHVQ